MTLPRYAFSSLVIPRGGVPCRVLTIRHLAHISTHTVVHKGCNYGAACSFREACGVVVRREPLGKHMEAHQVSRFLHSRVWRRLPSVPGTRGPRGPRLVLRLSLTARMEAMPSRPHALRRTSGRSNLLSPHGRHPPYTMRSSPLPGTKSSHRGRRSETTRAQSSFPLHHA
jgi:hypothetical protein